MTKNVVRYLGISVLAFALAAGTNLVVSNQTLAAPPNAVNVCHFTGNPSHPWMILTLSPQGAHAITTRPGSVDFIMMGRHRDCPPD